MDILALVLSSTKVATISREKDSGTENEFQVSGSSNRQGTSGSSYSCSLDALLRRLRAMDTKKDDKFADVLDAVGEFGTFQWRLIVLTFIPNIMSSFFMFADHFVFSEEKPYCNTSWILALDPNLSEAEQMNLTLPRAHNGSFLTCLMYLPVSWDLESIIQFGLNITDPCEDGWIYPESKRRSLISEFDLVCGKELDKETVQTMFMTGQLIGSLIFGLLSDKLGRYPTILLSLLGLMFFGFGTAFVNSFHQYLFFRFGVSQAVMGYAIVSLTLVTEWLVGEHRAHAVILEHCFFSVGIMFLTGLAYNLPHWRMLFLVGAVPVFPLISYIWILPESPRWLMMKGKVKEAKEVLCYAAEVNKKTIPLNLLEELQLPGKKVTKASVLDFYSNRYLCKVTLVMGCVWLTISYSYFTLSLKLRDFGVSIHFRQAIPGILEVPARLCSIVLLEQMGRKWSLAVILIQTAFMCFLTLFLPQGLKSAIILVLVLGQFSLATSVSVVFLYTAELFPTIVRSTGLGLVSLASSGGAILSLTIISQLPALLPIFLCFISSIAALCFSALLPETQNQLLSDSMEQFSRASLQKDSLQHSDSSFKQRRNDEDTPDDMSEEVAKNTIHNAQILRMDSNYYSNASLKKSREEKTDSQVS
ncbi:solute carrier family 22 member 14 [Marmota flaviventris]